MARHDKQKAKHKWKRREEGPGGEGDLVGDGNDSGMNDWDDKST